MTDAEEYLNLLKQKQLTVCLPPNKSRDVGNLSGDEEKEEPILTEDDAKLAQRGLPPQRYHAFVLYADEDVEFAAELIERMESVGLKVRRRRIRYHHHLIKFTALFTNYRPISAV